MIPFIAAVLGEFLRRYEYIIIFFPKHVQTRQLYFSGLGICYTAILLFTSLHALSAPRTNKYINWFSVNDPRT